VRSRWLFFWFALISHSVLVCRASMTIGLNNDVKRCSNPVWWSTNKELSSGIWRRPCWHSQNRHEAGSISFSYRNGHSLLSSENAMSIRFQNESVVSAALTRVNSSFQCQCQWLENYRQTYRRREFYRVSDLELDQFSIGQVFQLFLFITSHEWASLS
jgi:hypothetical protein